MVFNINKIIIGRSNSGREYQFLVFCFEFLVEENTLHMVLIN